MYNPTVEATAQLTLAVVKELLEHKVAAKAILAVIEVMDKPVPMNLIQHDAIKLDRWMKNSTLDALQSE